MGCNETATGWDWVDSMLIALEHLKMLVCVCVMCVALVPRLAPSPLTLLDAAKQETNRDNKH